MMDNLLELYAERIQAWKKASVRMSYSAIDPKRNAVALYEALTQLEAENVALLQFATLFYGMGADKWPEGAYEYYQAMPNIVAQKMDALLTGESDEAE